MNVLTKNKPRRKAKKRKEREKVMRSYMEGKKYENCKCKLDTCTVEIS